MIHRKIAVATKIILCSFLAGFFSVARAEAPPAGGPVESVSGAVGNSQSLELNEQGVKALQRNDFAAAEQLFRKALSTDPKNLTAAFNLSGVLVTNSKTAEAITLLNGYVGEFQSDPGLFSRLGDAYFDQKQLKEAVSAYEQAYKLDPTYPRLAMRLSSVYGLTNRMADAERMMHEAVKLDPRDVRAHESLASLAFGLGKFDDAIAAAKRALQIKPTSGAYVTLGASYEAKRDRKNALIAYQRAADLGDKTKELAARIASLQKHPTA